MKKEALRLLKTYLIFLLVAVLINLTLELIVPTPERAATVAEHGLAYFLKTHTINVMIFYAIFSLIGAVIFVLKNYDALRMGVLSFIVGFILEFLMMRPDWVGEIYALNIDMGIIVAVLISAAYWFVPWSLPAYMIHKYVKK